MTVRMKKIWKKRVTGAALALLAVVLILSEGMTGKASEAALQAVLAEVVIGVGTLIPPADSDPLAFDVERFILPEGARMLVVVEGTGGSDCQVYAYERPDGEMGMWKQRLCVSGKLGKNGMSNNRVEGDKTTPIGVFQMDTPFGQSDPLEGFPENYIKVNENYVWATETNRLEAGTAKEGELVGTKGYAGYYDYVLNAGYNKNAVEKKGSALFLHCKKIDRAGSSGCVEIPKEQMIEIMRLYGTYGDGACYIAQAPRGTFPLLYDSYGVNDGLSPAGDFTAPAAPLP